MGIAIRLLLLSPPSSFFLGITRPWRRALHSHRGVVQSQQAPPAYPPQGSPETIPDRASGARVDGSARALSLSLISFLHVFRVLVCSGVYLLRVFQSLQSSDVRDNNIPLQPSFLRPLLAAPVVSTVSHFFLIGLRSAGRTHQGRVGPSWGPSVLSTTGPSTFGLCRRMKCLASWWVAQMCPSAKSCTYCPLWRSPCVASCVSSGGYSALNFRSLAVFHYSVLRVDFLGDEGSPEDYSQLFGQRKRFLLMQKLFIGERKPVSTQSRYFCLQDGTVARFHGELRFVLNDEQHVSCILLSSAATTFLPWSLLSRFLTCGFTVTTFRVSAGAAATSLWP